MGLRDSNLMQYRPARIQRLGTNNRGDPVMATGTVKWFNPTKGFGFIEPEGGGDDAFVHITAVQAAGLQGLEDNQKVSYELEEGRNGKKSAVNLELL